MIITNNLNILQDVWNSVLHCVPLLKDYPVEMVAVCITDKHYSLTVQGK